MKARAGLSLVIGILVLGAFSACQEASKHKSQSTGSSQVSASSVVPSKDSLSDDRTSSTNKATQSNQAQLQQPHSDSFISASKVNSAISISSPDTDLSPKLKAITKKQAKDFCHSDWVKQHYSCKKGETCHYTQEKVYDDIDRYQCRILSLNKGLAIILTLENFENRKKEINNYFPSIDLIDISKLRVIDHIAEEDSAIDYRVFRGLTLKNINSYDNNLFFSVIFYTHNYRNSDVLYDISTLNIYQYYKYKIRKVLKALKLKYIEQNPEDDMENSLPKEATYRCINSKEEGQVNYYFVSRKSKEMPDLKLRKLIKERLIRGSHKDLPGSIIDSVICDNSKKIKVINRKRDKLIEKVIPFRNNKYEIPSQWRSEEFQ